MSKNKIAEVKKVAEPVVGEQETLSQTKVTPQQMRRIVIETDGDKINLVTAEVSGRIELVGILQGLVSFLNSPKQ